MIYFMNSLSIAVWTFENLQSALTQLLQYYQRFAKILTQPQFAAVPDRDELINFHRVMVEVKKLKPIFWAITNNNLFFRHSCMISC